MTWKDSASTSMSVFYTLYTFRTEPYTERVEQLYTKISNSLNRTHQAMAPLSPHNPNEPLLGGQSKLMKTDPGSPPLSTTTQTVIKALSFIRIATGAACLIAPRFTCALFKFPVPAEQTLLVRMVGARDAVLGELLITAEDKTAHDGGRR